MVTNLLNEVDKKTSSSCPSVFFILINKQTPIVQVSYLFKSSKVNWFVYVLKLIIWYQKWGSKIAVCNLYINQK